MNDAAKLGNSVLLHYTLILLWSYLWNDLFNKGLIFEIMLPNKYLLFGHLTQVTYCYGDVSIFVRHLLTSSFQKLSDQSLSNLVCSIFRESRLEILNFMTPGQGFLC